MLHPIYLVSLSDCSFYCGQKSRKAIYATTISVSFHSTVVLIPSTLLRVVQFILHWLFLLQFVSWSKTTKNLFEKIKIFQLHFDKSVTQFYLNNTKYQIKFRFLFKSFSQRRSKSTMRLNNLQVSEYQLAALSLQLTRINESYQIAAREAVFSLLDRSNS